eukprot:30032_1
MANRQTTIQNTNKKQLTVDDQVYLDYLAAVEYEQQEIINEYCTNELLNTTQMQSSLTDSEIMSLFDSGFTVDMIIKAYPEFKINKIKQLKRKWSDKNHNYKKKKKNKDYSSQNTEEKSESIPLKNIKSNKQKNKKRRKSKSKQNGNNNNNNSKNNVQCELCLKYFKSETGLHAHFQENVNNIMHGAV